MYKVNYEENWLTTILGLLQENSKAEMLLLATYINDGLCFEFFCEGVAPDIFYTLRAGLKENATFRRAMIESGILQRSVQHFISATFDEWDIWYHLLGGTETILRSPELVKFLPVQDRNLACSLLTLWREDKLNEDTWDFYIEKAGLLV